MPGGSDDGCKDGTLCHQRRLILMIQGWRSKRLRRCLSRSLEVIIV